MNVIKSPVSGYCFGVRRTINMALACVNTGHESGRPYYSIGQLIHNRDAVCFFEEKGLKVIKEPDEGPCGIALIRAHGIGDSVRRRFEEKGFELLDSTCPNIAKTRLAMKNATEKGRTTVIIGVENHAEIRCLMDTEGVSSIFIASLEDANNLIAEKDRSVPVTAFVQTTFSELKLQEIKNVLALHFADFEMGSELCLSCIRRKKAALVLAEKTNAVVVVGGKNSENTLELVHMIRAHGHPVFLVENAADIDDSVKAELGRYSTVGLCSGTSAPGFVIEKVEEVLRSI